MDDLDPILDPEVVQERAPGASTGLFFFDIVKFTLLAFAIVAPIRYFVAQPFIVNGSSMDPTFSSGDYLVVDQLSYRFVPPKRGDVVVFRYPLDPSKYFIKRIVGLPLETVEVKGSRVFITSKDSDITEELVEPYLTFMGQSYVTVRLGESEYFVMGDNRAASSDSRAWGPITRGHIVGSAFLRLYPFAQFDLHPGENATYESLTI
ncbi:MAG: signal peptidase I [Candidatus Vogelbacteria bacterium CG10_big_fil_rev_8_21_14_0_10_51_16]|uniref:Signal peptidase I n=1 Tax=Candidatus Vogelbacteria bacterium CG10_big_fil_rev_8_21_14_0_10_51_16 TaxID=1975045 RepID=A0A2H0REX5_9BACT|nr:MAG: signal peptidase I [Candidatus Vogelbacteria bacterium CG10_big_fil_rev_8_21_14_0_10_51_16]